MKPTHFAAPSEFRAWLEEHHATAAEVWVGFYKKGTGKPSMSWSEAVDEALCFGWIDSRQQGVDDESYVIRFTPRKQGSNWSLVNIRKVEELTREGRMRPAGLEAFERRFRDNAKAWEFFQAQAPSYRRTAVWWVVARSERRRGRSGLSR